MMEISTIQIGSDKMQEIDGADTTASTVVHIEDDSDSENLNEAYATSPNLNPSQVPMASIESSANPAR